MSGRALPGLETRQLLGAATVVALVATAGSLSLSLGLGLVPCRLCWYQRILMYPLVLVVGVAAVEERPAVARTALPLVGLGAAIAAYHSWLQIQTAPGSCAIGSCGSVQYRLEPLGLTVPNLSLVAFLLITAAMVVLWRRG